MPSKMTAKRAAVVRKPDDNVIRLSLFDRPLASGKVPEKFTFYSYFTFKNLVLTAGILTFLIFLGASVSVRLAFLAAVGICFLGLMLMEMSSRRRWERDLLGQLQRMNSDYDRLVRDVARNRNGTAELRKQLSDAAGVAVRSIEKTATDTAEQRMMRGLLDQLSKLNEASPEEQAEIEELEIEEEAPAPAGKPFSEETLAQRLTEDQVLKLVHAAVKQDRVDLFLQPIVGLPQRKLRFYEMFSRIRIKQGAYLPAADYIDIAHKRDLMPVIDNLLLLRGLQIIRQTEESGYNRAFFFNITSTTLSDPKFMGDLVEFIAQNRILAPRLVFELAQDDLAAMSAADSLPVLDGLAKLGCRFSMDQVRSLALDFRQLEARHIRFVKIDAPLLMEEIKEDGGLQKLRRLKGECDRSGIDLIVEKIETDRQLLELLEIDIDYGQGYLFGKPVLYDKP